MQYGAMNFPIKPIVKEIEEIHSLGFDYLELTMDPPQASPKEISRQKGDILKSLDQKGMDLICHLPTFLHTSDLSDAIRRASMEEILFALDVIAELSVRKAVLHPGHIAGMGVFMRDQVRELAFDTLEAVTAKADELGISLCLENMFPQSRSLCEVEEFTEVFERFPQLQLTLDTGHANVLSKGNKSVEFIRAFGPRIGHMHASDNLGKEDNHLPIGTGTVDFPSIIKALLNIPYQGAITLEVFSKDRDYLRISREKLNALIEGGYKGVKDSP